MIRCALPDVLPFLVILLTRCLFAAEKVIGRQLKDTVVVFAPRVGAHRANGYRIGVVALNAGFERAAAAHADGATYGPTNTVKPSAPPKVYFDSAKGLPSTYNKAWDMQ